MRISLNYLQILSLLAFAEDERLQDTAVGKFLALKNVFSGFSFGFLLDTFEIVDCSLATTLWEKARMVMIIPFLLWFCVGFLVSIWKFCVPQVGFGELTRSFSFSAMVMYTAVMGGLLGMLTSITVEGDRVIKRDTSLEWNKGDHKNIIAIVTLYCFGYGIVLPGSLIYRYGVMMRKAKIELGPVYYNKELEKDPNYASNIAAAQKLHREARRFYGFMAKGYKDHLYWWEGVIICRRTLCILVAVFASDTFEQTAVMLLLLLAFLVVHTVMSPYKHAFLNICEYIAELCNVICVASIMIVTGVESDASSLIEAAAVFFILAQVMFGCVMVICFINILRIMKDKFAAAAVTGAATPTLVLRSCASCLGFI
jgi:hypothetical protein